MKIKLDLCISLFLIVFCCVLFWQISKFPPAILRNTPAPSYFPSIVVSGLLLLSLSVLLQSLLTYKDTKTLAVSKTVVFAAAVSLLYVISVPFIGYFLCTFMFFLLFSYLHKKAFSWLILANSIIFLFFIYAFFYKTLGVPLPEGYLIKLIF